jgi:hypothetical protein
VGFNVYKEPACSPRLLETGVVGGTICLSFCLTLILTLTLTLTLILTLTHTLTLDPHPHPHPHFDLILKLSCRLPPSTHGRHYRIVCANHCGSRLASCLVLPLVSSCLVLLCCVVLCCVVLCCVVLCCVVLCCVVLCCVVFVSSRLVSSCVVLCCLVLSRLVLCCVVLSCFACRLGISSIFTPSSTSYEMNEYPCLYFGFVVSVFSALSSQLSSVFSAAPFSWLVVYRSVDKKNIGVSQNLGVLAV